MRSLRSIFCLKFYWTVFVAIRVRNTQTKQCGLTKPHSDQSPTETKQCGPTKPHSDSLSSRLTRRHYNVSRYPATVAMATCYPLGIDAESFNFDNLGVVTHRRQYPTTHTRTDAFTCRHVTCLFLLRIAQMVCAHQSTDFLSWIVVIG